LESLPSAFLFINLHQLTLLALTNLKKLINFESFSHIFDYCELLRIVLFLFIRPLPQSPIKNEDILPGGFLREGLELTPLWLQYFSIV
jgi:hypothetical protein